MPPRREAFITIGATATFLALIESSLSPPFLETLTTLEYTHLTIQCGASLPNAIDQADTIGKRLSSHSQEAKPKAKPHRATSEWWDIHGIKTRLFAFNKDGLGSEMKNCKAADGRREGVVVSHAGAGTILDAMRLDLPLIVVVNPDLLDNHQMELAEELERQGYVICGELGDLSGALLASEAKSQSRLSWQTTDAPSAADPSGQGIIGVMDEEVGYEMRTREILD